VKDNRASKYDAKRRVVEVAITVELENDIAQGEIRSKMANDIKARLRARGALRE
jgi:hypothetical protein